MIKFELGYHYEVLHYRYCAPIEHLLCCTHQPVVTHDTGTWSRETRVNHGIFQTFSESKKTWKVYCLPHKVRTWGAWRLQQLLTRPIDFVFKAWSGDKDSTSPKRLFWLSTSWKWYLKKNLSGKFWLSINSQVSRRGGNWV